MFCHLMHCLSSNYRLPVRCIYTSIVFPRPTLSTACFSYCHVLVYIMSPLRMHPKRINDAKFYHHSIVLSACARTASCKLRSTPMGFQHKSHIDSNVSVWNTHMTVVFTYIPTTENPHWRHRQPLKANHTNECASRKHNYQTYPVLGFVALCRRLHSSWKLRSYILCLYLHPSSF